MNSSINEIREKQECTDMVLQRWFDFYVEPEVQCQIAVSKGLCKMADIPDPPIAAKSITAGGILMLMVEYSSQNGLVSDQRTFDILADASEIDRHQVFSDPDYLSVANHNSGPGAYWVRYNPYAFRGQVSGQYIKYPPGGGYYAGAQTLMAFALFEKLPTSILNNSLNGIRLLGYHFRPKPLERKDWKGLLKVVIPEVDDMIIEKTWFDNSVSNSCSGVYYDLAQN